MQSSRQDLFIDMAVDRFIFKNNRVTLCPCFTFIPKTGLRKAAVSFYCVESQSQMPLIMAPTVCADQTQVGEFEARFLIPVGPSTNATNSLSK